MKKCLLFFAAILFFACNLYAQYYTNQNKIWAFGVRAGLDFTGATPVAIPTNINILEGCGAVSDSTGHLLFYTDGSAVWDRTGALMPHGTSIVPFSTGDAAQGAEIVPVVSHPNQYYIFSSDVYLTGHLAYSIVDMTLHGGLGDVVTPSGTLIGSNFAEKMTCVAANDCSVWLLTHRRDSAVFWVYNINIAGINPPVVSSVGYFPQEYAGVIKVSKDRRTIVIQNCEGGVPGHTELFDFDPTTGIVSNCRVLDSAASNYGAEFSPDNSKLYTSGLRGLSLYQYDLSLPTTAAIIASKTVVSTIPGGTPMIGYGDFKLGPDDKIYLAKEGMTTLDVVNNPNGAGAACGFSSAAIPLVSGTSCQLGLPNVFYQTRYVNDTHVAHDTSLCVSSSSMDTLWAHDSLSGSSYLWSDGTTTTPYLHVTTSGTYFVDIFNACSLKVDTIHLTPASHDTVTARNDTPICASSDNFPVILTSPYGSTSSWYNGTIGGTSLINWSGIYWVDFVDSAMCRLYSDTFHVKYYQAPMPIVGPDTVCVNDIINLTDRVLGGTWASNTPVVASVDSNGNVYGHTPGSISVSYSIFPGCAATKTVIVKEPPCRLGVSNIEYANTVEIYPNPATNDLVIKADEHYYNTLSISNTVGQTVRRQIIKTKETTLHIADLPAGIYYVTLHGDYDTKVTKFTKM